MRSTALQLIPLDGEFLPDPESRELTLAKLRELIGKRGDVVYGEVDHVHCPICDSVIDDWMREAMAPLVQGEPTAWDNEAPCCGAKLDLMDVRTRWPAGLAKFLLEVRFVASPRFLEDGEQQLVEGALGCRLRQMMAPGAASVGGI